MSEEAATVYLVDEGAILLYMARLPSDPEELCQRQMILHQERARAEGNVTKYSRLQARCVTREGIRRNANRVGQSILQVRTKDEQLEAVRRKLLTLIGEGGSS